MAEELRCFPRSDAVTTANRIDEVASASTLVDMRSLVSIEAAPLGGFYQLRRAQADEQLIRQLRSELVQVAERGGFPNTTSAEAKSAFDREAGLILHRVMQILPVDAAQVDVWRWLNAWAAPDLLFWRFGARDDAGAKWRVTQDRIHNRAKGFLSRLWWRVELLGEDLAPLIGEDESVALTERTTAVGYRDFGRLLVADHLAFCAEQGITNRGMFLRDVMKRVIRRKSVVEVAALSREESSQFILALLRESQRALRVGASIPLVVGAGRADGRSSVPGPDRIDDPPQASATEVGLRTSAASPSSPARVDLEFPLKGSSGYALEVMPYAAYSGAVASLYGAGPAEIRQGVRAIVLTEGPVTGQRVCRAYVAAAGMQHAGPQAKMDVRQALAELVSEGVLIVDAAVPESWDRNQFRLPAQMKVIPRTAGPRSLAEIPLEELAAVMDSVPHDPWSELKEVFGRVLERLAVPADDDEQVDAALRDVLKRLRGR